MQVLEAASQKAANPVFHLAIFCGILKVITALK
jgi:hypothetical protein